MGIEAFRPRYPGTTPRSERCDARSGRKVKTPDIDTSAAAAAARLDRDVRHDAQYDGPAGMVVGVIVPAIGLAGLAAIVSFVGLDNAL